MTATVSERGFPGGSGTGHLRNSKPRLGFLGTGWIGLNRMQAIARSGAATVAAIAEPNTDARERARSAAPTAELVNDLESLLAMELDGIVIATPSALHAEQASAALERGLAVFCQKPLARTASETRKVIDAAERSNRLLGVDLSYRYTSGMQAVRDVLRSGELGHVFALDLVFHNAYGPDKEWFYNAELAGGGCVIDLGIHLLDLASWALGFSGACVVSSALYSRGQRLRAGDRTQVEDFAAATLQLEDDAVARLTCSWKVHAGEDAQIRATFYGTDGGAEFRNVSGSFYDFVAERFTGTRRELLSSPPEDWGGRAAVAFAEQLAKSKSFDPEIRSLTGVAEILDGIYGR